MALVEKKQLVAALTPPLDAGLAEALVDEFVSSERRFIQRDWEPSQLDGGQFAEIAARILYHADSGNLNIGRSFDDCIKYIENASVAHALLPRQDALHLSKVLRTIYKFRSQRGAVHISPNYTPNHMDSKLIIECVRWSMNEILRIFWNGDREAVAKTIRELIQFDVPSIGRFEDILIVQRVDLSAEEEIVLLLHYAGEVGFTRKELGAHSKVSASSVTRAIQKLIANDCREIVQLKSGSYRLTDIGSKRVREQLSEKLAL